MLLILCYSLLLLAGIVASQWGDIRSLQSLISTLTNLCLSYIMIEVGRAFTLDKNKLRLYAWDFCVATTAAVLPWIFCAVYFITIFHSLWKDAAIIGLSAAPTSAGILFAMLSAAGLGGTWVFQKARNLAIFDDLATILLIIPVQIALVGIRPELILVVVIIFFLLLAAYRWLDCLSLPTGIGWLVLYGAGIVMTVGFIEHLAHIHLGVLLPSFALGCILDKSRHENGESALSPKTNDSQLFSNWSSRFDCLMKGAFMFLVGCSLPKIDMSNLSIQAMVGHVLLLTLLSNIGKCFPLFCYRREASFISRLALSVAMFPRGEVGAGVLIISISYGISGIAGSLAILSLALNLLLTGIFIAIVIQLLKKQNPA